MDILDFNNTKIAFVRKNNKELNKAIMLFKLIGNNTLVKMGKFLTNTALSIRFPINWAVKPTIYSLFVGSETLENCDPIINELAKYNVKTILDYSVEGGDSKEKIEAALAETLRTIHNAAKNKNIPFAVFKPTAFGYPHILKKAGRGETLNENEQKEADLFKERVHTLCKAAAENNIPIMIDAEDVAFQNFVDQVVYEMMLKFNKQKAIVFNTLQMYRRDRLDFLKNLYEQAVKDDIKIGIKFVRGAYMEIERELAKELGYDDPIHPNKDKTDKAFNAALKFSVEHIDRISKHVLPYLLRRTEENTSVAGQTSKELQLLQTEKNRRKNKQK